MTPQPKTTAGLAHTRLAPALAACALLACIWATSSPAFAVELGIARIPGLYRTWTLESPEVPAGDEPAASETKISQLHVPLVGSVHVGSRADLVVSTAAGSSTLDRDAFGEESLGGNTDVTAQLFLRLLEDRWMLQLGGNLPAGGATVTREELQVAQALSHPLLGFRTKQYGQGLDLSVGLAGAIPLGGRTSAALGAGYIARGGYEFVEGDPDFEPGNEISLSGGLDFLDTEGDPVVRFDATYRIYATDEIGSEEIYEEGNQLELQALGRIRTESWSGHLLGRAVLKDDNSVLGQEGSIGKVTQAPGTGLLGQAQLDYAVRPSVRFGGQIETAVFTGSDAGRTDGIAYGAGPTLTLSASRSVSIHTGALILAGSIDGEGEGPGASDLDLSGFELSFVLRWIPE